MSVRPTRAEHESAESRAGDGVEVRGTVVDADLEPASERRVGLRGAGLDSVGVEPRAYECGQECAVATFDDGDPAGAAAEPVRHGHRPGRVVAPGRDAGTDRIEHARRRP